MAKLKNKFTGQEIELSYDAFGENQKNMYKASGMWEEVDASSSGLDFKVTIPDFKVGFGDISSSIKPLKELDMNADYSMKPSAASNNSLDFKIKPVDFFSGDKDVEKDD